MARVQPNYSDVLSSLVAFCCKNIQIKMLNAFRELTRNVGKNVASRRIYDRVR